MKKWFLILFIGLILSSQSVLASPLALIPDDWYIHFFGGGMIEGVMTKWNWTPEQRRGVFLVATVGKELVDYGVFGGQFDVAEIVIGWLGKWTFDLL